MVARFAGVCGRPGSCHEKAIDCAGPEKQDPAARILVERLVALHENINVEPNPCIHLMAAELAAAWLLGNLNQKMDAGLKAPALHLYV
jgi:hypothetical protein